jgi:nitrilase
MRHIAFEGRCFVLSACQHLTLADWPEDLRPTAAASDTGGIIEGHSLIVSPLGDLLTGPTLTPPAGPELLYATIDPDDLARGKFDLDVAGHYARPHIFTLTVNTD